MKQDNDKIISSYRPRSNSAHLAEPPHVRERLIAEIKFFISSLQKKSDQGFSTTPSTDNHACLVEYVTHVEEIKRAALLRGESRSESPAHSKEGRETPFRSGSRGASNGRYVLSY